MAKITTEQISKRCPFLFRSMAREHEAMKLDLTINLPETEEAGSVWAFPKSHEDGLGRASR